MSANFEGTPSEEEVEKYLALWAWKREKERKLIKREVGKKRWYDRRRRRMAGLRCGLCNLCRMRCGNSMEALAAVESSVECWRNVRWPLLPLTLTIFFQLGGRHFFWYFSFPTSSSRAPTKKTSSGQDERFPRNSLRANRVKMVLGRGGNAVWILRMPSNLQEIHWPHTNLRATCF